MKKIIQVICGVFLLPSMLLAQSFTVSGEDTKENRWKCAMQIGPKFLQETRSEVSRKGTKSDYSDVEITAVYPFYWNVISPKPNWFSFKAKDEAGNSYTGYYHVKFETNLNENPRDGTKKPTLTCGLTSRYGYDLFDALGDDTYFIMYNKNKTPIINFFRE